MSKVQKLKKSGGIAGGYATPKQGSKKNNISKMDSTEETAVRET